MNRNPEPDDVQKEGVEDRRSFNRREDFERFAE